MSHIRKIDQFIADFENARREYTLAREKIDLLRLQALSLKSPTINDEPRGTEPSDPMRMMDDYIDKEREVVGELAKQYIKATMDFKDLINTIGDKRKRRVLEDRYLLEKSVQVIAKEQDVTKRWVYELIRQGLDEMDKTLHNSSLKVHNASQYNVRCRIMPTPFPPDNPIDS